MQSKPINSAIHSLILAATFLPLALPQAEAYQIAQASPTQSDPPVAPSFMRQAGQMLFDKTKDRVINGLDSKWDKPTQTTTTSTTTTTVDPSGRKQAAPCRSWLPNSQPTACLLCIHGLGLQSNSYEFFGTEQSKRGLAVYAIDVRGFGAWMNAGGKTQINFPDCLDDIKIALQSIRAANPGVPVYILGESMGGAIALRAASMYPDLIDGLVSSVPSGDRFNQGKTSAKVFLNLLTGFNIANVGSSVVTQATQNQKLRSQWENDPLSRLNLSPQELMQFQDFMNSNHEAAKAVGDMPVLFVQGVGDTLVKPEGTWELFNDVKAKDKSFFAVPGEHLIFEEAQTQDAGPRDQNFRVIQSWLTTKVGRRHRDPSQIGFNTPPGAVTPGGQPSFGKAVDQPIQGNNSGNYIFPNGGNYTGQPGSGSFPGQPSFGGPPGFSLAPMLNLQGLEQQTQLISNGNYTDAISQLEQLRTQRPNDPNILGLLAKAYFQTGQSDKARMCFRQSMRIQRANGGQGNALNSFILGGPNGGNAWASASAQTPPLSSAVVSNGSKGKVYAFYASWADQCKSMKDIVSQLNSKYGNSIDVQMVNIEDKNTDSLADKYNVGPIPTVVFVAPDGKVASTIIGESNFSSYERAVQAITPSGSRIQ